MLLRSLSARRAWIEMTCGGGRNEQPRKSLSARRAWIEICALDNTPRKAYSRSPQGERG